jgi:hydroxymethylbilane synthase
MRDTLYPPPAGGQYPPIGDRFATRDPGTTMAGFLLRIGTRGSPLALAQTALARDRLAGALPALAAADAVEIVVIRTTGDAVVDRPLAEIGGKGLFTKEIDEALLAGRIDLAVHSVKDLPTLLPAGIMLACVLPRADPRDALIASAADLAALPAGATVGTASLRRQAQLLARRPDLRVAPLRGNVATRIDKVRRGEVQATLLAVAGLERLGLRGAASAVLSPAEMLPAVGQAAIGLTCRAADARTLALLTVSGDAVGAAEVAAERAMLEVLEGSCRTPIGGLARIDAGGTLTLDGLVAAVDGRRVERRTLTGPPADAAAIGRDLGAELKRRAGPGVLAS